MSPTAPLYYAPISSTPLKSSTISMLHGQRGALALVIGLVLLLAGCVTSMPRVQETTNAKGQRALRLQRLNGNAVSMWSDLDGKLFWNESMSPDSVQLILYLKGPALSTPSGMEPVTEDTLVGRTGTMPLFLPDSMMNDSLEVTATRDPITGDSSSAFLLPRADSSFSYRTVSDQVWARLVSVKRYAVISDAQQTTVGVQVPVGGAAAVGVTISGPVKAIPITEITYQVPRRTVDDLAGNSVRAVQIDLEDDVQTIRGPELQEYEYGEKSAVQFREKRQTLLAPDEGSSTAK